MKLKFEIFRGILCCYFGIHFMCTLLMWMLNKFAKLVRDERVESAERKQMQRRFIENLDLIVKIKKN